MNTLPRWLTVLSFTLALAGCGGGSDSPPAPPPPSLGTVAGAVVASTDSAAIAGAKVTAGALSATAGADGKFTLANVPVGDRVLLKIEAAGYLDGLVAVPVVANQAARAAARLVRAGAETTINAAQASVVTAAGSSAQVALPANGLVIAGTANAPSGAVTVRVTPIDPLADPQSMPGDFTTSAGESIASFGAINVTLKDANGAALNLKAASTATIRIPLASRSANPPATIPLFYLDETTGRWVQEGTATLMTSGAERYYEGTVSHFTTWNADQVLQSIFVNGCAVTDTGAVVTQGLATSVGIDYSGSGAAALNAQGQFRVPMGRGGKASIYVEGANTSNAVVAGPSQTDITLSACLVIGSAAVAPTIVSQPQSVSTQPGAAVFFGVVATGSRPLAYQWRRNGVAIAGARGDVYYIASAAQGDNGVVFDVIVSNAAGTVTSSGATLGVAAPVAPTITTQPASLSVAVGAAASFSVTATGSAPLAYQWQRNGVDIAGATAATYTVPVTVLGDNGAVFRVRISNLGGSVTSANATLGVTGPTLSAPTITAQPQSVTVAVGQTASFSVSVTGSPAPTFQWRRNGVAIGGATASSYTTPAAATADNGAVFSVVVSNSQGSVTSNGATLTVNAGTTAQRANLVRLMSVAFEFNTAALVPFEATTPNDGSAFVNPATVCSSGTLSVTANGVAVTAGQPVPTNGTVGGVAINCNASGTVYNGQTLVSVNVTTFTPAVASGSATVTNMRVTDLPGVDITANGVVGLSINETVSGANTVSVETSAPAAGATLRSEVSGLTATFVSGSVVGTDTYVTATGNTLRLNAAYNNLTFTVAGVTYVGSGSYTFDVTNPTASSGQVILSTNGVTIGRLFIDTDGVLKIDVDGVVQPLGRVPKGPARR